ncbi:MAG: hypothetical protein EX270_06350 [Pseudomonadales bacterium]|nr:MAG: hypothetical protein EX270_06350 [Pseudomonadales bacterium]
MKPAQATLTIEITGGIESALPIAVVPFDTSRLSSQLDVDIAEIVASAIENVVRNAIQHTPSGGGVLVTIDKDAPDFAVVKVVDSGPGVAKKDLEKIFEPFYRINTNRPGAGIGLAISKRVLQQLGGALVAANRAESGLQITMRFPLAGGVT